MDAADIRASFRAFAGLDRYRKFVRTLNREGQRKGRLLFWQEELWHEFVSSAPGAPTVEEDIMRAFRVCDVHDCRLQTLPSDESPTEIRHTPEYDRALHALFPFAFGRDLVCTQCRSERQRWISENLDLCRILRRKTTYESYCQRLLDGLTDRTALFKSQTENQISERSAEIAAQMQPGDELWEWDAGGWHQLAGRGGVAIVRAGKIVKQWCEIRS